MTGGEIDGRQFNLRLSILICKMGLMMVASSSQGPWGDEIKLKYM